MQDMDFPMIGRLQPTHSGEASMPAIQSCFIEPVWDQFSALLPSREDDHSLGCHRPRVADRLIFEKLLQVAVFGCAYWRIADRSYSATTLRRRRDEWIALGLMDQLEGIARHGYDRLIGLQLPVNASITYWRKSLVLLRHRARPRRRGDPPAERSPLVQ